MKLKHWQNMFHVIINADSTVKHVIQIKKGSNDECQYECKKFIHAKKVIVGILVHKFVRIVGI